MSGALRCARREGGLVVTTRRGPISDCLRMLYALLIFYRTYSLNAPSLATSPLTHLPLICVRYLQRCTRDTAMCLVLSVVPDVFRRATNDGDRRR